MNTKTFLTNDFHLLPHSIQDQIITLMLHDQFSAAKELYDVWRSYSLAFDKE